MDFGLSMEKGTFSGLRFLFIVIVMLLLSRRTSGSARAQVVQTICADQQPHNLTTTISNMIDATDKIRQQMQSKGYGLQISGQGPDVVYYLAQCYGDISLVECIQCNTEAGTSLTSQCFPYNVGRIFLDGCFTRITNYNFFHEYIGPEDKAICGNKTRKNSAFEETTRQAVLQAASYAPNNNGYARVEMPVSEANNLSAYVLANCWNTLNASSCRECLANASTSMLGCLPSSEARALYTGCYMRYSDTNFLNPIPINGNPKGRTVVVAVIVSSTVVVVGVVAIGTYFWKQMITKKKRKGTYDTEKIAKILRDSSLYFEYSILEKATDGFDEANKIGQGGFSTVYKGVLPDGREIAIKKLFVNDTHQIAAFYNEVNIVSSVEHKNLVRLLGCSSSGFDSLLVYEFLPNGSLNHFIFSASASTQGLNEVKTLTWEERFAIIIDTAEGLVYLHENTTMRIIHRDIKASNILLDMRFHAKIADFGLVRSVQEQKSHITTGIAGTLGYMAPEYLFHGRLTEKVDVYSFGVLLLEIVTGRQNNGSNTSEEYSTSLISIVWKHFKNATTEELIDPNLMSQNRHDISVKNEALIVIHVGLLCVQEIPSLRPAMSEALQMLKNKDECLPPPTHPPYIDWKSLEVDNTARNSVATISRSIFYPR